MRRCHEFVVVVAKMTTITKRENREIGSDEVTIVIVNRFRLAPLEL